jgi:hypothetical protein
MALSFRSIAVGLAGLVASVAVSASAAPAQAQGFYPGGFNRGWGGPYRGWGGPYRGWGGPAYGYRPAYRWGYGPAYRPAYGPYGYGPRPYWRGYRPAYYGYGYGYGNPYGYYGSYDNGGAVVAGLIGGLALGAIASAPRAYRPVAYQPAVRCWYQPRRIVNRYGAVVVRQVRTCH